MDLVDVNVLVGAFRADSDLHHASRGWLDSALVDAVPVTILPEVAIGYLRVVTNPRVWVEASHSAQALEVLDELCRSPSVAVAEAPATRWRRFIALLAAHDVRGNDLHDALLAAAAIELGATLVTFDRGFTRFDGLRLRVLSA